MQSPNYSRNAHKAAQAERQHDYPMAVVFWQKAAKSECSKNQKHWAQCRISHCNCISERVANIIPWYCMVELDEVYSSHSFNELFVEVKTVNNKRRISTHQVDVGVVLSYFSDEGAMEMFNKMSNYHGWINQNKERLIDAWEVGFLDEAPITADTYEDFALNEWSKQCQDQK